MLLLCKMMNVLGLGFLESVCFKGLSALHIISSLLVDCCSGFIPGTGVLLYLLIVCRHIFSLSIYLR